MSVLKNAISLRTHPANSLRPRLRLYLFPAVAAVARKAAAPAREAVAPAHEAAGQARETAALMVAMEGTVDQLS